MKKIPEIPINITQEQVDAGLDKFITTVEEEIQLHHTRPEWLNLDEPSREEQNLIVRTNIILDMLEEYIQILKLGDDNPYYQRFEIAKLYFKNINIPNFKK